MSKRKASPNELPVLPCEIVDTILAMALANYVVSWNRKSVTPLLHECVHGIAQLDQRVWALGDTVVFVLKAIGVMAEINKACFARSKVAFREIGNHCVPLKKALFKIMDNSMVIPEQIPLAALRAAHKGDVLAGLMIASNLSSWKKIGEFANSLAQMAACRQCVHRNSLISFLSHWKDGQGKLMVKGESRALLESCVRFDVAKWNCTWCPR
jgi:hypothetical protein